MTATNTTDTFEFLWQTTRQRNEARQIAALLPRIPRGVQAIGSSQLACQLLLELDQWEVLADDPASTVYQATDARTGRDFAVKCLGQRLARRPECVRLFEAEMATCAGLSHPGVPQLQGVGRLPDGRPFFVMDFVHGPTIAQWRQAVGGLKRSPLTSQDEGWHDALRKFAQCCRVVAHAHARGMLHADLNTANLILGAERGYVLDWGAVRPVKGQHAWGHEPLQHPLATPAYMSPEQASGSANVGLSADVYGLGAILYFMLTGRPPVQGQRLPEVRDLVCRGDFPSPRHVDGDIPLALDAICRKAMATVPVNRFANPMELASEIEAWANQSPLQALTDRWGDWFVALSTPTNV